MPPEIAARVSLSDGAAVIAGIRPEDFRPVSVESWPAEASLVSGSVEVVEPLGPEQHLVVAVGGDIVTARVGRSVKCAVGEKVGLAVTPQTVHLFAADSGEALL